MSFITKRDRVFNDYDLFELPPRNECKLKAYGSCTDARAWSHFGSDKTEHLVDIVRRNNGTCRPTYLPTEVIVNTLMGTKNAEIARLKRKIGEFEQMIAAYDQLELSCDQKVEIANAHAAIKAANKELDDMCLDLDLSGFTEGIDSEAFETGKSRGDDPSLFQPRYRDDETEKSKGSDWSFSNEKDSLPVVTSESKENQTDKACPCDKTTSAHDPRIDEMQDTIITKDAKLSAMQNTIAVMENDVCEPFCIYAHIYTALEKIFGVLCQNDKYKQYLNLLTAGKDTRCVDIKGKILFKMKVLEKFCVALIAPCSQRMIQSDFASATQVAFHAEILSEMETSFALTSEEAFRPMLDNKRAQLVADIIEHDEMKKMVIDESSEKDQDEKLDYDSVTDDYSINAENVKRLKDLKTSYDDLMKNYENIQHEKDCLLIRSHKYEELEKELENLRCQLREYTSLWNEKEHYKRRSEDLDHLKEQYFVLTEETSALETRLQAEAEINSIKSNMADDLRTENIELERRLNESIIAFEKEKNGLQCKLKETECKSMCQEQQIRSLSDQVDRLLEQENQQATNDQSSIDLNDEIESLKKNIEDLKTEQILKELGIVEEKQKLENQYQESLDIINNNHKKEMDNLKGLYEKCVQQNESFESSFKKYEEKVKSLNEENNSLMKEIETKNAKIEDLHELIEYKSKALNSLSDEIYKKDAENKKNEQLLRVSDEQYKAKVKLLEKEKKDSLSSLELVRTKSAQLLNTVKQMSHENSQLNIKVKDGAEAIYEKNNELRLNNKQIKELEDINKKLEMDKAILEDKLQSFEISIERCRTSLGPEELEKESLLFLETLPDTVIMIKNSLENLKKEKHDLENDLVDKHNQLKYLKESESLVEKRSQELLNQARQSLSLQNELSKIKEAYKKAVLENKTLNQELAIKCEEIDKLLKSFNILDFEKQQFAQQSVQFLQQDLEKAQDKNRKLIKEIDGLQNKLKMKDKEFEDKLSKSLEDLKQLQMLYNNLEMTNRSILKEFHEKEDGHAKKIKQLEYENENLNERNRISIIDNINLQESLEKTQMQLIVQTTSPKISLDFNLKQIDEIKKEKVINQKEIRELTDQLDKFENQISEYQNELLSKNSRIAILENHINTLEYEIRTLHQKLELVLDTGEELKEYGNERVNQSMKSLEAHHSKATHNMKADIAKLKTLEHSLVTLQNSSQLLLTKANEAQKIAEKEKEKISNEKEDAIKEKQQLTTELTELKLRLIKQQQNIVDLKSEIQNDKLMSQSTQNYIKHLEDEIKKLKSLYDDSLRETDNFKKCVENMNTEKKQLTTFLDQANSDVEVKAKEIKKLSEKLDEMSKNYNNIKMQYKSTRSIGTVISAYDMNNKNQESQTKAPQMRNYDSGSMNVYYELSVSRNSNIKFNDNNRQDDIDNTLSYAHNETQTIKDIPSFNSFKRNYITLKMQRLGTRKTEHHSISTTKLKHKENNIPLKDKINNEANITDLKSELIGSRPSIYDFAFKNPIIARRLKNVTVEDKNDSKKQDEPKEEPFLTNKENSQYSSNKFSDDDMIYFYNDSENTSSHTNEPVVKSNTLIYSKNERPYLSQEETDQENFQTRRIAELDINLPGNTSKTSTLYKKEKNQEKMYDTEAEQFETDSLSIAASSDDEKDSINFYTVNSTPKRTHSDVKLGKETITIGRKSPSLPSLLRNGIYDSNSSMLLSSNEKTNNFDVFINGNTNVGHVSKESKDYKKRKNENSNRLYFDLDPHRMVKNSFNANKIKPEKSEKKDFGLEYILDSVPKEIDSKKVAYNYFRTTNNDDDNLKYIEDSEFNVQEETYSVNVPTVQYEQRLNLPETYEEASVENSIIKKSSNNNNYEEQIKTLCKTLEDVQEKCKKKIEVIKTQYDNNIKQFINEHNQGVKNMQSLHEQTLQDTLKAHENEVENLRRMTLEALRKTEKLEKENKSLKLKLQLYEKNCDLDSQSIKSFSERKRKKHRSNGDTRLLTRTDVEAFNVKPFGLGPCTCSVDNNISDTIKNIFEQVDLEQRKVAEQAYIKYIAQKIVKSNIDNLEAEELSFLHLKVCKHWKTKITKKEALQKKIDSLESELLNKQRHAQQHMAELDRRVADERRKLQEVREAVCLNPESMFANAEGQRDCPENDKKFCRTAATVERDIECYCEKKRSIGDKRSAGDLVTNVSQTFVKLKSRPGTSTKAILVKKDSDARREKKMYSDDPPTRLRRNQDRPQPNKPQKK